MIRQFVATVGEREIDIEVEALHDGRFRLVVDGQERQVDAHQIRPGTWSLLVDGAAGGRSFTVELDPRRNKTAASADLTEIVALVEDARRKALEKAAHRSGLHASGELVRAPIAGKVVKIAVAVGEVVAVGGSVAVLEAMKMENDLKAERGGTVQTIHVKPGQSVDTGELMITLV
jgi:glutaconyl-CoA/methylmalonyl-CoA decarboxylase subunit gamma